MQTRSSLGVPCRRGYALLLVIVFTGAALILATGIFQYASTTASLNHRHNEYQRAVAAAEAATEKVVARVTADYREQGDGYILGRLDSYRSMVPTSSEFPECGNYLFQNLSGQEDRLEVTYNPGSGFEMSSGKYSGLRGVKSTLRVVANAKARYSSASPAGAVFQDIELLRIPLFQFAIFYNLNLEFNNHPPMTVYGPVHCNTNIYMSSHDITTFNGDVTAAGQILHAKNPLSPESAGSGPFVYNGDRDSGVSTLNLPIGTNTSPAAVRAVIEVPPALEDPYSSMGQQRYYNKADLIIIVQDMNIITTSGLRNSFATQVPATDVTNFVSTNVTFYNKRQLKTIKTTQIDIAKLILWKATNIYFNSAIPSQDIRTIFVVDQRTQTASTQSGVRLINGQALPVGGLTVATPNPIYVRGHYNAPPAHLGTTNTTLTQPASVAADSVTLLSTAWSDANSSLGLSSRIANHTTINAAMLTGFVETSSSRFSGGVENLPRFLEDWDNRILSYNGSMVAMYTSRISTNAWGGSDVYNAPDRHWGLDQNYLVEGKLPPATPNVTVLIRGRWRMPAPYSTNVLAGF